MDATKPHPHEHAHAHGVAAEPDRVSTKIVVGFAVLLTLVGAGAAALMAAMFWRFDKTAQKRDERIVAEAGLQRQEAVIPPLPRLQVYPVRHWKDFQQAERERLETYGWMDQSTGAVHIPIERAIDLIAERGVGPLPQAPVVMPVAPAPPTQALPERKQ
jgi:hypothetical protein